MDTIVITLAAAAAAVLLMFVGLGLTRIIKGRDLQSDIGTNDDMKRLGIKCASQEMREQEAEWLGREVCADSVSCGGNCAACETVPDSKK